MPDLGRETIQVVEIDLEVCSRTYGSAPCTAALGGANVRKCYNTFFTCQDEANFDSTTKTLRFGKSQSGLPSGLRIYPALRGVSTNATRINPGQIDDRTGPLGKRARVTVSLADFPDSDIGMDPYRSGRIDGTAQTDEGGYDPLTRGTLFGKLRRRNPYYIGRPLRVLDGFVGDAIGDMTVRNYIIAEWTGPDAQGRVEIVAKDVLDLADSAKALCPAPSQGKIDSDIADSGLPSFDLLPASVGDEYAASGRASLGSEIVTFTRSGDTITLTARALDGTEAASHSEGDLFQQCYHVDGVALADVAIELLEDFAGIDPSFIPSSTWQAEGARWLAGFDLTATIAKPTGVAKLLGELSMLGAYWWWDPVAQEIGMRANRPLEPTEVPGAITDAKSILKGSAQLEDLEELRLTQVMLWHGQLDKTGSASDGANFAKLEAAVDLAAESDDEYAQKRVKEIFSRWLGSGDASVAAAVAARLKNRYRNTPRQMTFRIDAGQADQVDLAGVTNITSRLLQDETGNSLATPMQIMSIEEVDPNHALEIVAQDFTFNGRYGLITENSRGDYAASSAAEIAKGTYIVGASGTFGDGTGPYLMF